MKREEEVPVDLASWVSSEYAKSMDERVDRLRLLINLFGPNGGIQCFFGGDLTKDVFEEIRWCFINGQFIACVLLCQCFIENSLRNLLSTGGLNYDVTDGWLERVGFRDLINKSLEEELITEKEADDFHWLRKARVQYVHPKLPFSRKWIVRRMVEEEATAKELAAQDAVRSVRIVLQLIQRAPFRL